jgi:hypothetical protein
LKTLSEVQVASGFLTHDVLSFAKIGLHNGFGVESASKAAGPITELHILPLVTLSLCLLKIVLCDMTGGSCVFLRIEKSKLIESRAQKVNEGEGIEHKMDSIVQSSKLAPPQDR